MKSSLGSRHVNAILLAIGASVVILHEAQAQSWSDVVAAAKKEGQVTVHGGPGRAFNEALALNFQKAYPGIKVNFTGGSARSAIPKIIRERKNGIYVWDVFVGGAPSGFRTLKASGAYAPLAPYLKKDLLDDKLWLGGFAGGWLDKEKKFSYGFDFTAQSFIWVNWDVVSRDKLKTVQDLLKPEFAGKISWSDPRTLGEGIYASQVLYLNLGEKILVDLFTRQKIIYPAVRRQGTEWLVRGRYPIAIAASPGDLAIFKKQGIGKNIGIFNGGLKKEIGSTGYGCLQIMDKAPHPNAARLYVNWLLSKQGQAGYADLTKRNSRRLDVNPGDPQGVPRKGFAYISAQSEKNAFVRRKVTGLAKKLIAGSRR